MTNIRIHALSLPSLNSPSTSRPTVSSPTLSGPSRIPSRPPMGVPALALALAAVFVTSACGSAEAEAPAAGGSSAAAVDAAEAAPEVDEAPEGEAPDACSLLTIEDIKAATGATFDAGEGTDYDNTCRYDTSSDRVTVSISDTNGLALAKPIGIDVVPVDGLAGATRVDAVVYVEIDGGWLSVGTALPGFAASEREAAAAEELAKLAVSRL